jgi:EAL domain-containing protein (putative c-di-GMP-specific phosphodiesterase class I)
LQLVKDSGFPLSCLTLEITETAIMQDPVRAKAALLELRQAGIHLSMDDFGIGQSSLTYLKELPITKMKIDKSFVMEFERPSNVAIVRSAIDLARNMDLQVTAEGVEDAATFQALRELGCDLAQGYYFSKPLPVDKLVSWLGESEWGFGAGASAA